MKKLRADLLGYLQPLESALTTQQYGLSQSEGRVAQGVTQSTLQGLANRGVLQSSYSAPAVAQAVAPIEQRHQENLLDLLRSITAAKTQIAEGTSLPGYGGAFGESFGQGGDLLAYLAGRKYGGGAGGGGPATSIQGLIGQQYGPGLDTEYEDDPYSSRG